MPRPEAGGARGRPKSGVTGLGAAGFGASLPGLVCLCVFVLGVILSGSAVAQPSVTDCDRLAAAPDDPDRSGNAVLSEEVNLALAERRCREASRSRPDSGRLHFQYGRVLILGGRFTEAVAPLRKAAALGYRSAHLYLGRVYESRESGLWDRPRAMRHYETAGYAGHPEAQLEAGLLYRKWGLGDDHEAARQWLERAAEQGHTRAKFELGNMHSDGTGVPMDQDLAISYYRSAAADSYEPAELALGVALWAESDDQAKVLEGIEILQDLAGRGYGPAIFVLGMLELAGKSGDEIPETTLQSLCQIDELLQRLFASIEQAKLVCDRS